MAKKKYSLSKKDKQQIEKNWFKEPFSKYGGKALQYLKDVRAESLARIEAAKQESARTLKKAERSYNYYKNNPIIIDGRPLPVDSISFETLKAEAAAMGMAPRTLAKKYEQGKLKSQLASVTLREQSLMKQIRDGDRIIINGKKSSKTALKKRLAEIRNSAANFSKGFDMDITYTYDIAGNIYFNMPTPAQLAGIDDPEDFENLFDEYDDISITIS